MWKSTLTLSLATSMWLSNCNKRCIWCMCISNQRSIEIVRISVDPTLSMRGEWSPQPHVIFSHSGECL